jgi:hypothetical protein
MDEVTISDLTVDEFRMLVREVVAEALAELFTDPDEGLELREEFEAELKLSAERRLVGKEETEPLADVLHELGLQ